MTSEHDPAQLAPLELRHAEQPHEELAPLERRHPRWNTWRGEHTGKYWAAPLWDTAPYELVEGTTISQLEQRMTTIERAY